MFQLRLYAPHKSLLSAQLLFVWSKEAARSEGWLCGSATGCTPAKAGCAVYQVDLYTVRGKRKLNVLATRLRGHDNSLPVVLENYSSEEGHC